MYVELERSFRHERHEEPQEKQSPGHGRRERPPLRTQKLENGARSFQGDKQMTFSIDTDNSIAAHRSDSEAAAPTGQQFSSQRELATILESSPATRLAEKQKRDAIRMMHTPRVMSYYNQVYNLRNTHSSISKPFKTRETLFEARDSSFSGFLLCI